MWGHLKSSYWYQQVCQKTKYYNFQIKKKNIFTIMKSCVCVVVDTDVSRVTVNDNAALCRECQWPMCGACLCERAGKCVYALCLCVCVFLWEPCWSALAKQRSVQYRSDVDWADLTEPRPSTNPAVFRSPGPYLMSLGKKRGSSFSCSLFPLSFPLILSFSLFFSCTPSQTPALPGASVQMNVPSVYSAVLSLPLALPSHLSLSLFGQI